MIYIEPGSPWENGYCESFNSKLRDELLRHYGARAPDRVMPLIRCGIFDGDFDLSNAATFMLTPNIGLH